jgi:hypothetical protein
MPFCPDEECAVIGISRFLALAPAAACLPRPSRVFTRPTRFGTLGCCMADPEIEPDIGKFMRQRRQPASGRHVALWKKCKVERGAVSRVSGGFDRRTLLNGPGDRR